MIYTIFERGEFFYNCVDKYIKMCKLILTHWYLKHFESLRRYVLGE